MSITHRSQTTWIGLVAWFAVASSLFAEDAIDLRRELEQLRAEIARLDQESQRPLTPRERLTVELVQVLREINRDSDLLRAEMIGETLYFGPVRIDSFVVPGLHAELPPLDEADARRTVWRVWLDLAEHGHSNLPLAPHNSAHESEGAIILRPVRTIRWETLDRYPSLAEVIEHSDFLMARWNSVDLSLLDIAAAPVLLSVEAERTLGLRLFIPLDSPDDPWRSGIDDGWRFDEYEWVNPHAAFVKHLPHNRQTPFQMILELPGRDEARRHRADTPDAGTWLPSMIMMEDQNDTGGDLDAGWCVRRTKLNLRKEE